MAAPTSSANEPRCPLGGGRRVEGLIVKLVGEGNEIVRARRASRSAISCAWRREIDPDPDARPDDAPVDVLGARRGEEASWRGGSVRGERCERPLMARAAARGGSSGTDHDHVSAHVLFNGEPTGSSRGGCLAIEVLLSVVPDSKTVLHGSLVPDTQPASSHPRLSARSSPDPLPEPVRGGHM